MAIFFPVAGTSISLSLSRAVTTLPVSPSYWGKTKPNTPAPGLAVRNCRHLCFCRRAGLAVLRSCYAAVLGLWGGFLQTLEGLQEKHLCGRAQVSLPVRCDMQGASLCSWPAPYPPPHPINEIPSQMAGRKDPFLKNELRSLPDFFSACPLIKLGVPETVVQPPLTGLHFSFHS